MAVFVDGCEVIAVGAGRRLRAKVADGWTLGLLPARGVEIAAHVVQSPQACSGVRRVESNQTKQRA